MKKITDKELMEAIKYLKTLEMLEEIIEIIEQQDKQEKAVADREMPVPFIEEFEVEDLVLVNGEELGMIIAIDKNDNITLPYLVRIGNENCWLAEEEIELADIDLLLQEGKEELEAINGCKESLNKSLNAFYTYLN